MIKKKSGFINEKYISLPNFSNSNYEFCPLTEATVSEIGYYPHAKYHYRERPSGIDEYIIIYCLEGAGTIEINSSELFTLSSGMLYCINKNTSHRYYSDATNSWSILWLHFSLDAKSDYLLPNHKNVHSFSMEKRKIIQNHFIELLNLCESNFQKDTMICISQLLRLILTEITYLPDKITYDKQSRYLSSAIKYMHENIDKELALQQICNHLDISSSYLSSIFKNSTNQSPIAYFTQLRMEQACKYLRIDSLKIYEVAKMVGYQDPYYFSRIFKKTMHKSPKEYRLSINNN